MIQSDPPPMPKCWTYLQAWKDWLMLAHASGMRLTRRQDTGKYAGQRVVRDVFVAVDYCIDCSAQHRGAMEKQNRCFPSHAALERGAL